MKKFSFPVSDSDFKVSSYSDPGGIIKTCVSVAQTRRGVAVRDTKDQRKKTLFFSREEWDVFVRGVKNDEFDLI